MNNTKQKLLLEYLISSPDLWARCAHIIKAEYWDPDLRPVVSFIADYKTQYNALPDSDKVTAETGIDLVTKEVTKDTLEYCSQEIETFCKRRAIQQTIMHGQEFIDNEDWAGIEQQIREAVTISLHRDLGLDYFEDPLARLKDMIDNNQPLSTGWENVDWLLGGGLNRQEILIMAAESGGGKSMSMLNLARNMIEKGYKGIYYSLELSENLVAKRTDSMMSNISQRDILKQIDQVATAIAMKKGSMGSFTIKQFPAGISSMVIRSHLAEFELLNGWTPDFIILDYLDLMSPAVKVSMDNLFVKDKYVTEELRSLAVEFNLVMVTASQLNRSAVDQEDHNHAMIAGGISKIQTADNVISIRQTDAMRNCGEISFQFLKTRSSNGVGKKLFLTWDPISLLITDDLGGNSKNPTTGGTAPISSDSLTAKPKKVSDLMGMFPDVELTLKKE